jgi:hypothetical protein
LLAGDSETIRALALFPLRLEPELDQAPDGASAPRATNDGHTLRIDNRGAVDQKCDHDLQQDKTKADEAFLCAVPPGKHQRDNGEYKRREQQQVRNTAIRGAHFFTLSPSSTKRRMASERSSFTP